MRKYLSIAVVVLLISSLYLFAKLPFSRPNMPYASYVMDNGTTIQYVTFAMWEFNNYFPEFVGVWRPYDTFYPTIYGADLWVCHINSPSHADYASIYESPPNNWWINEHGEDGLYRPGNPNWPSNVAVMSPHDTWASFTDVGHIGLWVGRQTMMWDGAADADYFIESYWVKNITSITLSNLYLGRYCDFDFMGQGESYMGNISGSDLATRTVWMRNRQFNPTVWAGMRGLNFTVTNVKCSQPLGDFVTWDQFEQWEISQLTSGSWPGESGPNDWFILPICGPFSLAPDETKGFTFATAFGSTYADMMANLNRAKYRYDGAATIVEPTTLGRIKGLYK